MDSLLAKVFTTALTFRQVAINPDRVMTEFDPSQDKEKVVGFLHAGCAQMRKVFGIETVNSTWTDLSKYREISEACIGLD
jgi:hypothetical protein